MDKANDQHGTLLRLLGYARDHKRALAIATVLLLLSTLSDVLGPMLIKVFIDDYLAPSHFVANELFLLAGAYLGLQVFSALTRYLQAVKFYQVALAIVQTLREQIFAKVLRMPLTFFDRTPSGSLLSRITNDSEALRDLYVNVIATFIQNSVLLLGIFLAMAALDPSLMLLCLILVPLVLTVMVTYQKLSTPVFRSARSLLSDINARLSESIQGMVVIQALRQERRFRQQFSDVNQDHRRTRVKNLRLDGLLLRPLLDLFHMGLLAGMLWIFGFRSFVGPVEIGVLYAFINYLSRMFEPIIEMTQRLNLLQQSLVAGERLFEILDRDEQDHHLLDKAEHRADGSLAFERVNFSYDGSKPVLKDVSFSVKPGEFVAVVGHTGSGKSTLMNLLLGFYPVNDGTIRLGSCSLNELSSEQIRRQIGLVQQDPFLFVGTIADNLRMGHGEISDQRLQQAARDAQADGFIQRLAQGYQTELGERGGNLSAGQRQLLALARTLAQDPRILILDEATANVDSETESAINAALAEARQDRTTLAIAHRLSTIVDADQILVLHQGEIVERGTHGQLLSKQGLYWRMWRLQQQGAALEEHSPLSESAHPASPVA